MNNHKIGLWEKLDTTREKAESITGFPIESQNLTYSREQELQRLSVTLVTGTLADIENASQEIMILSFAESLYLRAFSAGIRKGRKLAQDDAVMSLISIPSNRDAILDATEGRR